HYGFIAPQAGSDNTTTHTVPLTLTVVRVAEEKGDGTRALPTPTPTPTPPPSSLVPTPPIEATSGGGQSGAGGHPEATPSDRPAPSPTSSPSPAPTPETKRGALDEFLSATLYHLCPRANNLFYGGVLLRPRQGARAEGGYKCLKAGPGAAGFSAGEDGDPIGSLSYSGVIPFFGTGPYGQRRRPLAVAFDASAMFERSRLINGAQFDERRKGGSLRLALPLRSAAEEKQFDLSAEAGRQTVSLIQGQKVVTKFNLTTLDLAARFYLDRRTAPRPRYWELTPRLRLGLGLAASEPTFALFSGTAATHGAMGYSFDYDVKGQFSVASAGTPLFERPSLGAPETVRGFRRDDAIGLRLWAVQPELWLRGRGLLSPSVNPLTGMESKFRELFRENLSFAVFYDVGGIYRTVNSPPGIRHGIGGGLRFNYEQRAYIKLDWAYGVGDRASGKSRFRFFFTLDLPENPF
ncbi:MAG: Omp85 superfamily domain, partial [Blastocatellia bacterium]|nr:Omp85 superfamily domain [Blastocatellia bacterium]